MLAFNRPISSSNAAGQDKWESGQPVPNRGISSFSNPLPWPFEQLQHLQKQVQDLAGQVSQPWAPPSSLPPAPDIRNHQEEMRRRQEADLQWQRQQEAQAQMREQQIAHERDMQALRMQQQQQIQPVTYAYAQPAFGTTPAYLHYPAASSGSFALSLPNQHQRQVTVQRIAEMQQRLMASQSLIDSLRSSELQRASELHQHLLFAQEELREQKARHTTEVRTIPLTAQTSLTC